MCGIVGLQLRGGEQRESLGEMLAAMLGQVRERGPDSAGVALYGDETLTPPGQAAVTVLAPGLGVAEIGEKLPAASVTAVGDCRVITAPTPLGTLVAEVRDALPGAVVLSTGSGLAVLKGVGDPARLAASFELAGRAAYQGVGHTRMATESAITVAHGHPFSVRPGMCLVHNGSFANHDTIRRELAAEGVHCDTDNDSEVAARFVGWRLDQGDDLHKALRLVCERFDGFYTLLVTTPTEFAVVRDAVACKPALLAETEGWVAMASEYRALAVLPGIEGARVFEPGPEEVHLWER